MTVYVTNDLKEQLKNNFVGRLHKYYKNNMGKVSDELGERIYNFLLGSDVELLRNVPTQYLSLVASVKLRVNYNQKEQVLRIPFNGEKPWITGNNSSRSTPLFGGKLRHRGYYGHEYTVDKQELWDQGILAELDAIVQTNYSYDDTIKKTRQNFNALLDQNRTLRQLIKAFPPVKSFVPEHILAKLADEPRARVGKSEGVDREFLTGMAAMARMVEA